MSSRSPAASRALAYDDVRDAWNEYLAHDNHGRGVVLIGHSQGTRVLIQLVKEEIDGKPIHLAILADGEGNKVGLISG